VTVFSGGGPWDLGPGLPRGKPDLTSREAEKEKTRVRSRRRYRAKAAEEGRPEPKTYKHISPPSVGGPSR